MLYVIIIIIQNNIILIVLVISHLLMRALRCPLTVEGRYVNGAVEVLAAYFGFCFLIGNDGRRPILLT